MKQCDRFARLVKLLHAIIPGPVNGILFDGPTERNRRSLD
jgi:hypothetical protein